MKNVRHFIVVEKERKIDMLKVGKWVGIAASAIGMIVTSIVSSKENEQSLAKLVDERMKEKQNINE